MEEVREYDKCIGKEKCLVTDNSIFGSCSYYFSGICNRIGEPKPKDEPNPQPCDWQGAKDNSPPQRGSILDEAKAIINGERNDMYGNPEDSFMLIAELWSALLGIMISAKDVALMMCLLKIARETKQGSRDNWRDLAGYAALGADMEGRKI